MNIGGGNISFTGYYKIDFWRKPAPFEAWTTCRRLGRAITYVTTDEYGRYWYNLMEVNGAITGYRIG